VGENWKMTSREQAIEVVGYLGRRFLESSVGCDHNWIVWSLGLEALAGFKA